MSTEGPRFTTHQQRTNGDLALYCSMMQMQLPKDTELNAAMSGGFEAAEEIPVLNHPTVVGVQFYTGWAESGMPASGMRLRYKEDTEERPDISSNPKSPVVKDVVSHFEFCWHDGDGQLTTETSADDNKGNDMSGDREETGGGYELAASVITALHKQDPNKFPDLKQVHSSVERWRLL